MERFKWKNIERYIYLATIAVGVIYHFYDKGANEGKAESAIVTMQRDISEIKSQQNIKFRDYDNYWFEQKEVNGAVITALGLDVD